MESDHSGEREGGRERGREREGKKAEGKKRVREGVWCGEGKGKGGGWGRLRRGKVNEGERKTEKKTGRGGRREGGRGSREEVKLMNDVYLNWYLIFETSIGSCFEERFSSFDISILSTEEES